MSETLARMGGNLQVSRTLYPGDLVPSNDSSTVEIVVIGYHGAAGQAFL